MAEATPAKGADAATALPAALPFDATNDQAIDHVANMLAPPAKAKRPTSGDDEPDTTSQPDEPADEEPVRQESEGEGEDEAPSVDEAEGEDDESEPKAEDEELPDTLEGLAEALGMEPADLSAHLKLRVKAAGQDRVITLSEVVKGYQMESDYRAKTSELAEQRKAHEAQVAQVAQVLRERFQTLDTLVKIQEQQLGSGFTPEQLDRMAEDDPMEYMQVTRRLQRQQETLNAAKAQIDGERRAAQEQQKANQQKWREAQYTRLVSDRPELSDPVKLNEFESRMRQGLTKDYGFGDDEVTSWFLSYDHRHVKLIDDALRLRAMERGKGKTLQKLKGKPKVIKPGMKRGKSEESEDGRMARLKKLRTSRSRKDQEAAAIEHILKDFKSI